MQSNPTLSRIQVCCEGYQRNEHIYSKCEPICTKGCANGVCVRPNECTCYPDHVKNLAGLCQTTCPQGVLKIQNYSLLYSANDCYLQNLGCENGDCNHNTCVCKEGYRLDRSGKFCVPHCHPACGQGSCVAPNTCECNEGYEVHARGGCVPKCPQGCEQGECVAPGQCSCPAGYKLLDNKCAPFCERGCVNGDCIAPNTCACTDGYTMDPTGTRCEARCEQACLNGM